MAAADTGVIQLWKKVPAPILQALRRTSISFALKICGQLLFFLVHIILARALGPAEYGIYALVLAWMNIALIFSKCGFDTLAIKCTAAYWGEVKTLRAFWVFSQYFVLTASLVVAAIGATATHYMAGSSLSPALKNAFFYGWIFLPVVALYTLKQHGLLGAQRPFLGLLPEEILRPALLVAAVSATAWLRPVWLSGEYAIMVHGLVALVGLAFAWVSMDWCAGNARSSLSAGSAMSQRKQWTANAVPLMLVAGSYLLLNRLDVVMLGSLSTAESVGAYSVATRIATAAGFGLIAVQVVAAPMIARAYAATDHEGLRRIVSLSVWVGVGVAVPLFSLIVVFGRVVLSIFGEDFTGGHAALLVLAMGQLANALTGPVGNMMSLTNSHNVLVTILIIALVINGLLNWLFIPVWDTLGAAIATACAGVVWNLTAAVIVWRRYRINCTPFVLRRA